MARPKDGQVVTDESIRRSCLRLWNRDQEFQRLRQLAYSLGVAQIFLADRSGFDKIQGQYFHARANQEAVAEALKGWDLSSRRVATINRILREGGDVIILFYATSEDFSSMLAHEIGHHINRRLGGLRVAEMYREIFPVSMTMRLVSGFEDHFLQNRDEFFAECWACYLCGYRRPRTLLQYLKPVLDRVRAKHPKLATLIERHRVNHLRPRSVKPGQ